ncbi:MAG: matrixin family metalloprotease [Clostridia bacterium]|nr:matrixin family metalloprotease [Clostridia bacterium]
MTVRVNSTFASESKAAVDNALYQWKTEAYLGNHMFRGSDHSITTYPLDDDINAITKSNAGPDYLMETNATNVNILTRYIYEFDINVNTYYPWKNNGDNDAYDVQNVMTHEIGHGLGIAHSDVSGATMEPTASLGMTSQRTIEADDKAAAAYIY